MSRGIGVYTEHEIQNAKDLVRALVKVIRGFRLYDDDHPTLDRTQGMFRRKWQLATAGGPLQLRLTEDLVLIEDQCIYESTGRNDVLPSVLYDHGIVGLIFLPGVDETESRRFAKALSEEPDPSVDFSTLLWEADLQFVQVLLDSDEADDEDATVFADEVVQMGDSQDPPFAPQYELELRELDRSIHIEEDSGIDRDLFAMTDTEKRRIAELVLEDNYLHTLRHSARVVHALSREDIKPEEAPTLENTMRILVGATLLAADIDGVLEMLRRAHYMRSSKLDLELRLGEMTYACMLERDNLRTLLRGLDGHEYIDPRTLGELLAQLGREAAPHVAQWLLETPHCDVVAQAQRLYGDSATEVLVPLYMNGTQEDRDRIGPALLSIGSAEALTALSSDFRTLPEQGRLKLLAVIARSTEPELRRVIVGALGDASERVRRAGIGALRKGDGPLLAPSVRAMFDNDVFDTLADREVKDFFELFGRIGDANVANALAEQCTPRKRFGLFGGGLTPMQNLCLRALRRMRDPSARAVVDDLKRHGPRHVREILDDPLADL